jgi:hypothetical protein
MNEIQAYIIELFKNLEAGELANFPDPAPPSDLGAPLTQDDIDFIKTLKKEVRERFNVIT